MKIAQRALLLTVLALTACGAETNLPKTPGGEAAIPSSDLALPVTAPMMARERLLHDLGRLDEAARKRATQLDKAVEKNR